MLKMLIMIGGLVLSLNAIAKQSTCYGTTASGSIENAVKLPFGGKNFITYSKSASLIGRTYVHSDVYDIVIDAYKALEVEQKGKVFKYAETGFEHGGKFAPHKTHQNGLSVDFMVPVILVDGTQKADENESSIGENTRQSVHLPTNAFNKLGYAIEFDKNNQFKYLFNTYEIDYEAMAAHIVLLHKSAQQKGIKIWRVIFDPNLQPFLMKTKYKEYLKKNIQFSTKRAWVRHDEHYHVDFIVDCK